MRKWLLFLCLALPAAPPPAALEITIGPRFSLGHTFDYGRDYQDYLYTRAKETGNPKFSLGVFSEIRFSPLLALQPELMFTRGGHGDTDDLFNETSSVREYLEAVLLAKLIVPTGRTSLQLFAGPDIRYGVGTWEYNINDVTVAEYDREGRKAADIRNTYLGIMTGVGIRRQWRYNSFHLDARFYLGLQNLDATDAVTRKPAALWLTLGYGYCVAGVDRSALPQRFRGVSPQYSRVESRKDIADNPFFSAYLDSGYIRQLLEAHAVMMDMKMGSPAAARFLPFDTEVFILTPVEILAGPKHPAAGVWLHRFRVTRQGTARTYNLWFEARKRQTPRIYPGVMGTTRAGLGVQDNLEKEVHSAASARVKNPANRDAPPLIVDSRVLPGAKAGETAWQEEWTVRVGSETVAVLIDFSLGPFKILNYKLAQE